MNIAREARRHLRLREREGAWFAAALASCAIAFALWPPLDVQIASLLWTRAAGFYAREGAIVQAIYIAVPHFGRLAALLTLALVVAGRFGIRWPGPPWRRRLLALGLSMTLGVGLLVNGALKEGWGRARPVHVQDFGGPSHFTPALRPTNQCRTNCSFVTGHAATGFALTAIGLFGAARTRKRWLAIGIAAGLAIGAVRMAQGAHFASDVLFSGLVVWGTNLAIRAGWLRWVAWRRRRRAPAETVAG
jgi:lipid A 4'-phosphatase